MREQITLACTECKRRNYLSTKAKKIDTGRVEYLKFCKYCNKRTKHRETR
jgi:large subunit ribosomal protein L33